MYRNGLSFFIPVPRRGLGMDRPLPGLPLL